MQSMTKADLLNVPLSRTTVEWGERSVHVREMTGAELDSLQERWRQLKTDENNNPALSMAEMCVRSLCDETGARLFTDEEVLEVVKLPTRLLRLIVDAATDLSGLSDEEIGALEGNSTTVPS